MTNKEIPIFFTIDGTYAPYLDVAIRSMIAFADKSRKYRAIVLYEKVSKADIEKISSAQTDFFKIDFREMRGDLLSLDDRMSNRLRCDYFTLTIYFRLFIPVMFPEYDKGIYIDSDVVLNNDIAKLFNIDLKDNFIGACNDLSIADIPKLVAYTENAVGVKKEEYINSGVLLMNLKMMREKNFAEHFLNLLNTYHFDTVAPDQDYLNAICNGKILYLGEEWDTMPNDAREKSENPSLIHYNLFSKPWCYDNIMYAEYFWKFAKDSAYYDTITEFKNNYSDERKKSDSDCLAVLINRAAEISENDITFKKLYEKGVKIRL